MKQTTTTHTTFSRRYFSGSHSRIAIAMSALAALAIIPAEGATLSFSDTAPTVSGADISSFTATTTDAGNVGDGNTNPTANDASTYVAADRGVQGQTFMTGSNPAGYTLSSVTLRHVTYGNTYYDLDNTGNFAVRVGSVVGTAFTQIANETAAGGGAGNPGAAMLATGSGKYLTFTLGTTLTLLPNTVYGFDLGSTNNTTIGYFETNGTNTNPYAGGTAYTSGANGVGNANLTSHTTGDRVFHVSLTAIPEPSAALLGSLGMLALLRRRRSQPTR